MANALFVRLLVETGNASGAGAISVRRAGVTPSLSRTLGLNMVSAHAVPILAGTILALVQEEISAQAAMFPKSL